MQTDDAAAIRQVKAGDRDAFRVLVERYSRVLFGVAFRISGNEQDAEEIVQETFVRAYRSIATFEFRCSFSSWLYTIANNCALDIVKRRRPMVSISGSEEDDEAPIDLASDDPSPERQVLSGELKTRITSAMAQLTGQERTAFVLRHFEGKSIEEISEVLGIRGGSAKNAIYRAVQKLRHALQPFVSETQ